MSIATVNYLHNVSLKQRFIGALDTALSEDRIDADEHLWLQSLTHSTVNINADPVRADRLSTLGHPQAAFELSAALMLSHTEVEKPQVYLFTLASGIEAFNNRSALVSVLNARFAEPAGVKLFEAEKIEGDPFQAQMGTIVDREADLVENLTAQLKTTPGLRDASTAALAAQLLKRFPGSAMAPDTHLVQVLPRRANDQGMALFTQTLAQAMFDDCRKLPLGKDSRRRFLDAKGDVASDADSILFSEAMTTAATEISTHYTQLLAAYWSGTWRGMSTRRDLAIESFNSSFRRELYTCHHNGTLSAAQLEAAQPLLHSMWEIPKVPTSARCQRLTLKVGSRVACELAATFVVTFNALVDPAVWWYSPDHRLIKFADMVALTAHLSTVPGRKQLYPLLAIHDQPLLHEVWPLQFELRDILTSLAADRVDSVIALQARNLTSALARDQPPEEWVAMIDDALDVRRLIDPRQLQFSAGRWSVDAPLEFSLTWPMSSQVPQPAHASRNTGASRGSATASESATEQAPATGGSDDATSADELDPQSWMEYVQAFDSRAQRLRELPNVLTACAEQALQRYTCVLFDGAVAVRHLHVQWRDQGDDGTDGEATAHAVSEGQKMVSLGLVPWLLDCVSGHRAAVFPAGAQVLCDPAGPAVTVRPDLIEYVLKRAVNHFADRYASLFESSRQSTLRQGHQQLWPANEALTLREDAMRLDLALARRQDRVHSDAFSMALQVLDCPTRSLRKGKGLGVTEAYLVSLAYGTSTAWLGNTMMLRQPDEAQSRIMLWSSDFGWREFASVEGLQAMIRRFFRGTHRQRWLALMSARDRRLLAAWLDGEPERQVAAVFERIDGHAVESLQQRVLSRQLQDVRELCLGATQCHFESGLFTRLAGEAELDWPLSRMLDELALRIDNSVFVAMLPPWIRLASVQDLKRYYAIFKRYYEGSDVRKDYMFGIDSLQVYTRKRLVAQLANDFAAVEFDPDTIMVHARRYVSGIPAAGELPSAVPAATIEHSESLTWYAINRFIEVPDAALSVTSSTHPQAQALLTPDYLRRLVSGLDIGTGYLALLRKGLSADGVHYAERKRLFFQQMPPALMAEALMEKVEGKMSDKAYAYITSIAQMPDGIAREPVDGVQVMISPLRLVADADMSPDPVSGMYIIGPVTPEEGPVVLYAVFNPSFVFREYASRTALIKDLRNDSVLQQLVVGRLDPEVRKRYTYGGFNEPHVPFSVEGTFDLPLHRPAPVVLSVAQIKGNALQALFDGAVKLLLDSGVSNAVTNQQVGEAQRRFLATLVLGQALMLMPSRLAALISLWQGHTLLRASAISASGHRWGEAFSEFSAALGMMVTAREQADEGQPEEKADSQSASDSPQEPLPTALSWRGTTLTEDQQFRLQQMEAHSVALSEMQHDGLLNLYRSKTDATPYAVVSGRVYQVRQIEDEGRWVIVGPDGAEGPFLTLDDNQHWQLDLTLRLRGGGGISTRFKSTAALSSAEGEVFVEASGMSEIRVLYRNRALQIGQAHLQTKRYLETCLDNLHSGPRGVGLDARAQKLIADFFGVARPDQFLIDEVEHAVRTMFNAVMDASLAPFTSPRFVVCTNRPGRDRVAAFIVPEDPLRRVFLTERFFRTPVYRLTAEARAQGFELMPHAQAATLIHELSHQALDTKDIAYLESTAPFPDLLLGNTASNVRVRAQIELFQGYRLSHRTSRNELFQVLDNGVWRDLAREDARGYSTVLRISGKKTLDEARTVFLSDPLKRSQIMLKNADSLTLLILMLGRHNFRVVAP